MHLNFGSRTELFSRTAALPISCAESGTHFRFSAELRLRKVSLSKGSMHTLKFFYFYSTSPLADLPYFFKLFETFSLGERVYFKAFKAFLSTALDSALDTFRTEVPLFCSTVSKVFSLLKIHQVILAKKSWKEFPSLHQPKLGFFLFLFQIQTQIQIFRPNKGLTTKVRKRSNLSHTWYWWKVSIRSFYSKPWRIRRKEQVWRLIADTKNGLFSLSLVSEHFLSLSFKTFRMQRKWNATANRAKSMLRRTAGRESECVILFVILFLKQKQKKKGSEQSPCSDQVH